MNDDIRPSKRPGTSLRAALDERAAEATPKPPVETETFQTPEEVAAADATIPDEPDITVDMSTLPGEPAKKPSRGRDWKQLLALKWPPKRKEFIVASIVLTLGLGIGGILLTGKDAMPAAVSVKPIKKIIKPKVSNTVASTLSGLPVDPTTNTRPVTGIMIENSQDARPQSGLNDASVVFEAIAEGGITRFLALYQDTAPESVGPIRSARPYYVNWVAGFDAGYAHVGGSPEALAHIKAIGVRDLDQFANGGSYQRIGSRAAPHNVYTSIATLNSLEQTKGYSTSSFSGFVRKKAAPKPATAKSIDLKMSGPLYNVHYDYDAKTNSYLRSEGGTPHMDANGSVQVNPAVVVAMVIPYNIAGDGLHSEYQTIGSGAANIFQDGVMTAGTWTKTSEKSQITFTDAAGKPLALNPGKTWLTAVSTAGNITYAP